MKIDSLNAPTETDQTRAAKRVDAEKPAQHHVDARHETGTAIPTNSDTITVSGRGAVIRRLVDKVNSLSGVRNDKVDALRSQIASGNYHPPADKIADAIFKSES
jgi:flagellar biosynthesis anti-sigma factor FlgM